MADLLPHILLITGTFILAGLVKGVTGLGLPTVSMGLLGLAMSPVQAAGLLLVASLVTNLWQLFAGPPLPRSAASPLGHDAWCRRRHARGVGTDRRHGRARGDC